MLNIVITGPYYLDIEQVCFFHAFNLQKVETSVPLSCKSIVSEFSSLSKMEVKTTPFVIQTFCLLLLISHGNPHIFSNPFHLKKLFDQFLQVGHTLRTSNKPLEAKPRIIKNYYHFWLDVQSPPDLPLPET